MTMIKDINEFYKRKENQRKNKFYFTVKELTYFIDYEQYLQMRERGIGMRRVVNRVSKGWRLEDAIEAPIFLEPKEYVEWLRIKDWSKEHKLQTKVNQVRRLRKHNPWLETVPQKVKPSPWFEYLSKNDMFPKIRV